MIEHVVTVETDVDLPARVTRDRIASLVHHVLAQEGIDEPWEVGIQFVDDPTMQAAHVEFMDIDEPTDIMTFPYADDDDVWGDETAGGDLLISAERAAANAAEAGWPTDQELYFVIAHGLLHLNGWDDHSDADRTRMLDRQQVLLESWQQPD